MGSSAPAPILFVHHGGIDWIRGSTRCLLDLLTYIDRSRFAPRVWTNQPAIQEAVSALDVPVHQAEDWPGCHPLRPDRRWMAEARELIREHRVRLIHADEFSQVSMLVPVARNARLPLLAQLHQVPSADERLWSLLHQVDLAVGTTGACIAGLLDDGFPPDRAVVIYNGVDPSRLSSGDASSLRASLGLSRETLVVTMVGSLIHRKAVDVALRAFALLRERTRACHLLVCGSGPEHPSLEALAESLGVSGQVTFLGECSETGAILRDATDILLATSRDESFGLTLAEAGVFAIPVVASRIAAHVEVVGNEAGMLAAPEDAAQFASCLEALAHDPALRRQVGESARRRVEAMFLVDRYVGDLQNAYSRLLEAPPASFGWVRASRWPRAYNTWIRDAIRRRIGRGGSGRRVRAT